jgi:acyl-CoA hydrolase
MAEEIDIAGLLRPGDGLAWSTGPVEPVHLLGVLDRQLDRVPQVSALLNVSFQTAIDAARLASRATVTAFGGAVTNRRFQEIGALDVLPINYSAVPDLVANGSLPIDVVLLQLAASNDAFNLSLMVDHAADAVPRARVVIAEINDLLPVTFGETRIEMGDVDHMVHVSRPPFELHSRATRLVEREIAAHVCRLIGDGATLQIGLGSARG